MKYPYAPAPTDAESRKQLNEKVLYLIDSDSCERSGITPEDIRSSKRTAQISTARKVAAYVVREVTGMPLAAIGTEFGGRDHSTVVYATNKVKKVMQTDPAYRATVEDLIKNISNV